MTQSKEGAPLGLYLHIPYCRTKCPYCDFISAPIPGTVPEEYIAALIQEIEAFEDPRPAQSIFFGGGTPSLLRPQQLEMLLQSLHTRFVLTQPEITIEANPDDVTHELVQAWRDVGINRVSLGVQSFDDAVLRYLGRRHDAARALEACEKVAACFSNWNIDLIFGAPPVEAWTSTLEQCRQLAPPHIAAYGLTYEADTPFGAHCDDALDEDASLLLYRQAEAALESYQHYEISNYALPQHESQHNLVYWRNEAYAGFGTGAFSYLKGIRSRNHSVQEAYLQAPGEKEEALTLSPQEIRIETIIQHLRLKEGLLKDHYQDRFGTTLLEDFRQPLEALLHRGLILDTGDRIIPSQKGFYLNNEIGLALVG